MIPKFASPPTATPRSPISPWPRRAATARPTVRPRKKPNGTASSSSAVRLKSPATICARAVRSTSKAVCARVSGPTRKGATTTRRKSSAKTSRCSAAAATMKTPAPPLRATVSKALPVPLQPPVRPPRPLRSRAPCRTNRSTRTTFRWPTPEGAGLFRHSCRTASMGSSFAALRAGKNPKITPVRAETPKASRLIPGLKRKGTSIT